MILFASAVGDPLLSREEAAPCERKAGPHQDSRARACDAGNRLADDAVHFAGVSETEPRSELSSPVGVAETRTRDHFASRPVEGQLGTFRWLSSWSRSEREHHRPVPGRAAPPRDLVRSVVEQFVPILTTSPESSNNGASLEYSLERAGGSVPVRVYARSPR